MAVRLLLLLCLTISAQAATYYVAASGGSDSNSCATAQTSTTPKATFSSAWTCLSAGDTLIVKDGTYNQNISPPASKAGSSGSPITIQAEHDGLAKITGNGITMNNSQSYLTFAGLNILSEAGGSALVISSQNSSGTAAHHITVQRTALRCPLRGSTPDDGVCVDVSAGAHHNLLEDNWAWGGGRYIIEVYGRDSNGSTTVTTADNNTFRRNVIRLGPHVSTGGNPQACLVLYYASSNIVENNICIDSQANSDSDNSGFYLTGHATPPTTVNNQLLGNLVLHMTGGVTTGQTQDKPFGIFLDLDQSGTSTNNVARNNVIWDVPGSGIDFSHASGSCTSHTIDHNTIGYSGSNSVYSGITEYQCGTTVTGNLITNFTGAGLNRGATGSMANSNNLIYSASAGAYTGSASAGTGDVTVDPQLSYIGKVETGTPCASGKCGADITKRYADGTLTGTNLWPWPNEALIKQNMCTDSSISTGFCAASSLTAYVWGTQYGNTNPFAGVTITISPTSLTNGTVGVPYSQTLTPSGGSSPYICTVSSGVLPSGVNLSSCVLTGTPASAGTSTFTVLATDNASNTGSQSLSLTINAASNPYSLSISGGVTISGGVVIR